jgi:hypothetical protein
MRNVIGPHGYSLERLRCGDCWQVFTAEEPERVCAEKCDETAAARIVRLPAATQWEIVEGRLK